jgi:hypothetical protein
MVDNGKYRLLTLCYFPREFPEHAEAGSVLNTLLDIYAEHLILFGEDL